MASINAEIALRQQGVQYFDIHQSSAIPRQNGSKGRCHRLHCRVPGRHHVRVCGPAHGHFEGQDADVSAPLPQPGTLLQVSLFRAFFFKLQAFLCTFWEVAVGSMLRYPEFSPQILLSFLKIAQFFGKIT